MTALLRLWRGALPLGEAFWLWGILGGAVVNLFLSLAALLLLAMEFPPALALLVLVAPIPYNVLILVGVWRSAGRPEVEPRRRASARTAILLWFLLLCLL